MRLLQLLFLNFPIADDALPRRWNIRVELSRPVYKALHELGTLRILHLRLQAGPSLYEVPPPLPFSGTSDAASQLIHIADPTPPPPPAPIQLPPPPTFSIPTGAQLFYVPPVIAPPPPPIAQPKHIARNKPFRKSSLCKEPPTLSRFKNLKSLSVLDIDSLDIITELKSCVRNSASTLTKLQLSFSDYLGSQARKPPPDLDPEDSDPDDEFQVVPVPPMPTFNDDASGPARAFRAQEERKSQEAVLGRIFDVEPYLVRKPTPKQPKVKEMGNNEQPSSNPGQDFIKSVTGWSRKLMKEVNESSDLPLSHLDLLDLIEEAAKKYVESEERDQGQGTEPEVGEGSSTSSTLSKPEEKNLEADKASESSLFEATACKPRDTQKDADPDDIDIEEPLEQLSLEAQDSALLKTPPSEPAAPTAPSPVEASSSRTVPRQNSLSGTTGVEKAVSNLEAQKTNFKTLGEKLASFEAQYSNLNTEMQGLRTSDGPVALKRLAEAEKQMQMFGRNIRDVHQEMSVVEAEIDDAEKQIPSSQNAEGKEATLQRHMTEYLRSTRGLALETLSVYLIPVKASVLNKAIDIRALRRLTLLNVGNQAPIWVHFLKENRESPLALRKIFTDNVSMAFLNFVSSLEELHDLFMLERENKYKPESFAPKTNTTIAQIRRLVLKKHMPTLRRLMIKNHMNTSWDLDEKTFNVVCGRGQQLQELACSTNIKAMVNFVTTRPYLI